MSFLVRFWGTRGSIPTPGDSTSKYGGNTSCVEVRIDDHLFILDGGTGLRELGADLLGRNLGRIEAHLLFSHMHWDHIQGFPFFVPAYVPNNKFFIYGASSGDRRFYNLLSGQMRPEYFPVDFSTLNADISPLDLGAHDRMIEGVRVRCLDQRHPGGSYAYSLEKNGVKLVYSTDNEIDLTFADPEHVQKHLAEPRPIPPELVEFCKDANLLIVDGQYSDQQYWPRHVGWGHSRATTVVDLAIAANVKEMAIFHHDPIQTDALLDAKIGACRQRVKSFGSPLFLFPAREGLEVKLD